jgi:hypothetical protein
MTLADFLKLKKRAPFKTIRTDAKSINFGAIFGCSGPALAVQMKEAGFDENKLNEGIKNLKLENAANAAILSAKPGSDPLQIKYSVLGNRIRELFFKLYPSLNERTLREQEFAKRHGYVRSWTGPVRHLQELRFMNKNSKGEVIGADRKLYSGLYSHLCNDATNSPIQTAEVYQAMPDATAMHNFMKKLGLRSRLFNYVHDSQEDYEFKPEKDLVDAYYNYLASIARQPNFNIPMHIDKEESDPDENEIFRDGREVNICDKDIKVELKKWCEKYNKHFTFDDIDAVKNGWVPLYGVVELGNMEGEGWKQQKCEDGDTWEYRLNNEIINRG